MGPLASAEFVKTIYDYNMPKLEQEAPGCILLSDPTFPDRTQAILNGSDDCMTIRLCEALQTLCRFGVGKIVITCMTSHYFLHKLPLELREKVISLVDLTMKKTLHKKNRVLLLCTNGVYRTKIFQRHEQWPFVKDYIVIPHEKDQQASHDLIYQLKQNPDPSLLIGELTRLVRQYKVDAFIAGCTEFHILVKHLQDGGFEGKIEHVVDPLFMLAKNLKHFLL